MTETTNLKLFKHDNAETNRNKFDIEKALNENWDKIDNYAKQVNNNISDINKELENFDRFTYKGIVNTYNDLTNKIATKGDIYKTKDNNKNYIYDGETWIEYELKINLDSIEENIETNKNNIKIITDCISNPVETSGKTIHIEDSSENLCEIEIEGNSKQETREGKNLLELTEGTYTNNGITATIKEGIIAINGTSTALTIMNIALKNQITIPANTNYKLRAFNKQTTNELNRIRLITKEGTNPFDDCFMTNINANVAIGRTTEYTVSALAIRIDNNQTLNNFIIKPQLELGDGTDTFEQGGKSPSPNYPSKIECCGGNINIIEETFKGYNLNSNGGLEKSSSFNIQIAKVKANKTYVLNTSTNLLGYYNEKPTIESITYDKSRIVLPSQTNIITAIRDGYIAIRTSSLEKVKLEQGSISTPYSKYGQGNIDTKICNKNLAKLEFKNAFRGFGSGEVTPKSNVDSYIAKVEPNKTYSTRNAHSNLCFFDKNMNYISGNAYQNASTTKTFTTNNINNVYYATIAINSGQEFQLEEGIATPYEEHKEQTYTMPIQEEMLEDDTFDWNKEEEVHTWGKVILTGEETLTYQSSYSRFKISLTNSITSTIRQKILSNYFKFSNTGNEVGDAFIVSSELYLYVDFTTTIDFKQWLKTQYEAGTPVTIYYKLAQEKRIPFTQEQKEIANKISRAKTYKPVTNIWTDGIEQIKVKYKKDPETIIGSEI